MVIFYYNFINGVIKIKYSHKQMKILTLLQISLKLYYALIKEYGQLFIIKHFIDFLSCYVQKYKIIIKLKLEC